MTTSHDPPDDPPTRDETADARDDLAALRRIQVLGLSLLAVAAPGLFWLEIGRAHV